MMNYANGYSYNPYYLPYQNNMVSPHPSYFANVVQNPYGTAQQNQNLQQQAQNQTQAQQQSQQTITTQPPIMQPNANANINKIYPVANREEATVAPIDLINGTPSFFINKSNGEIYYKQFDVPTGSYIFKTYAEIQPVEKPSIDVPSSIDINAYEDELRHINEGIDSLHRMLAQIQRAKENQYPINIKEVNTESIEIEPEVEERKTKSKRN